ncbi:hybrid sensor histidine kinase/response regulator [Rhizobacter sp. OV335]|uniref:hybrid sensor histidine kinase/response regulator n=1 Tax=Rhizobacter sp. OV335 TaxID=1500264 RepID=UPI0009F820CA|nr:ATP-binding protein [Rhizobacter sp. OV335]
MEVPRDMADPGDAHPTTLQETPLTRFLRAVMWGAAIVPLAGFIAVSWWAWRAAADDGRNTLVRTSDVAARHAQRIFDASREIAEKSLRFVGVPDDEVRANEAALRTRLMDTSTGIPGVRSISVWDAQGHHLVGTGFPVGSSSVSIADRNYFQQMKATQDRLVIGDIVLGRASGMPALSIAVRRPSADGGFGGVVVIALQPAVFEEFYRSIALEEAGVSTFTLFKADGTLLTRWPALPTPVARLPEASPVIAAVRRGEHAGVLSFRSSFDGASRTVSYQQVRDLPVYVSSSLRDDAILADWKRLVALLAAITLPVTIGLVSVAWLALRKTQLEQRMAVEIHAETRKRAQAEKAALQSQKLEALAQLTGGVAHDFNNLLAIVNSNLHVVKKLRPDVAEMKQIGAISRAVGSGARLTRQLLSFSRRQALKPERVELATWLPAVSELLKATLGSSVALSLDVAPDVSPIRVDVGELELALINLASNARDAMPGGGRLTIEASQEPAGETDGGGAPGRVLIRATDTGTGIEPALLAKVFEPFFTTKPASKGSGLGLSQVQGFCVQAGGSAEVRSEPGQGTSILMWLPARPGAVFDAVPASLAEPASVTGNVLLVDDNDEVVDATAEMLQACGLQVHSVRSADAALDALAQAAEAPDLVFSDVSMPGDMDGIQLAHEIRRRWPALPVVLLTGYATRVHDATAAGFRVLSKPVGAQALLDEFVRATRGG